MADGVTYRVAGLEDYQAVLDINHNVYEGLDYVPALYHQLITDKDTCVYVAEKNGKVIGLSYICIHFSGKAIYGGAGRIHTGFQHKGIMEKLNQYSIQHFLAEHPNIKQMVFTAKDGPHFDYIQKDQNYTLLGKENVITVFQTVQHLKVATQRLMSSNPMEYTTECLKIKDIRAKSYALLHLFNNEAFFASTKAQPFEATYDGIEEAMRITEVMIAKREKEVTGIAFFSHLKCNFGTYSVINFHGINIESFKILFLYQLIRHSYIMPDGNLGIVVCIPLSMELPAFRNFLLEALGCFRGPQSEMTGIIVRRNLDQIGRIANL